MALRWNIGHGQLIVLWVTMENNKRAANITKHMTLVALRAHQGFHFRFTKATMRPNINNIWILLLLLHKTLTNLAIPARNVVALVFFSNNESRNDQRNPLPLHTSFLTCLFSYLLPPSVINAPIFLHYFVIVFYLFNDCDSFYKRQHYFLTIHQNMIHWQSYIKLL